MKNPIYVFDTIKESFILYVKTAFGTKYPTFEKEREDLLKRDRIFARAPWVEPLPEYLPSDFSINEINSVPNLNDEELTIFKNIAGSGLGSNFKLHQHQYEMLQKAMAGNHCVITSGTGSGKTEAFLLPLFAYLSKEINKWRNTADTLNNAKWWNNVGYGPARIVGNGNKSLSMLARQRPDSKRPTAVRAMLIYPMNALVEDQLSRLRSALDSDIIRDIFNKNYNKNRIYFGRYNSTSPVSGKLWTIEDGNIVPDEYKIKQLKKELKAIEDSNSKVSVYLNNNPDNLTNAQKADLLANFQRLDGAEMRTRFDMQITPPDILITNFSMLSIMLMRDIENPIFDQTKNWLLCEDLPESERENERKERIFHIIIDELHLYRGGSGSEIAYIIRMLLDRIGLTPDCEQLRILASSASLEGEEGKNFLKSFFGIENKDIIIIQGAEKPHVAKSYFPLHNFVREYEIIGKKSDIIENLIKKIDNIEGLNNEVNIIIGGNNNVVINLLEQQDLIKKSMYSAFIIDGRIRAVPAFINGENDNTPNYVKSIAEILFGSIHKQNKDAVKGFFFLVGLLEKFKIKHSFPRIRFHFFYRNIPGLWGELISDSEIESRQMPIGELLNTPQISHNGHRTLELIYCENCGTLAFGGSKVEYLNDENPTIELLPVSPDIEGVPDTSPATIIEKRKYKDFGIFCPGTFGEESELNTNVIEPEFSISSSNGKKLIWRNAWLNINSGKIDIHDPNDSLNYVKGRFLQVAEITKRNDIITNVNYDIQEDTLRNLDALPNICPHCEADYSNPKKKRHSPFRGFRTGFGKVSQLLSKELFNLLPQGERPKKLVAFSDSREDAAKLSKNIEEEHYLTLLKEVIIYNLTNDLQIVNDILIALDNNNEQQYEKEPIFQEIFEIWENVNGKRPNQQNVSKLSRYKENIKPISDFTDIVIREMLKLGVNPGGPFVSIKNFKPQYKPWYEFFDFQNKTFEQSEDGWQDARSIIIKQIEQNIANLIFGRLYFSFEASGLGYATIQNNEFLKQKADSLNITPDLLLDICNSYIRIVGDSYKHNRTDYTPNPCDSYKSIPNRRKEKRYIKAVSNRLKKDEENLGTIVFSILENNHHRGSIIEINNLFVKIASRKTQFYKCQYCGTIHLHKSGGICVFCLKHLSSQPETKTVESLWSTNFLTVNLNREYKPFRIHTEELTGQTDDQLLRQRQFKSIFLDPKDRLTQEIDLLSVTTTLEVGVDIGTLQAIFLANMPPQRFNYQQRVGRTGRRGQIYSYSLTFARGRSHDEFYFENPLSITGDKPPQPFLCLDQERIFKRMLTKAILRFAYQQLNISSIGKSVHGEFGSVQMYNQIDLQNVIDSDLVKENSVIYRIFNSLNIGIYSNGQLKKFDFSLFSDWISLIPQTISEQIDSQNSINRDLAELLAETGMLPMGGMPTRIRNLIHGFRKSKDENGGYNVQSIDRDLGIAIYEFAPGAQKTKDKGVIQAIGFTADIQGIEQTRSLGSINYQLKAIQNDAFTERKWLIQDRLTKSIRSELFVDVSVKQNLMDTHPDCDVFIGAVPAAFRTDFRYPKDSNEEFDINFSKPLTFAETKTTPECKVAGNYHIKYAQQELTWKINNNGGNNKLFTGQYVTHQKYNVTFKQQWISNDFIEQFQNPSGNIEQLALSSSKITEVFRIEPQQLSFELDINPFVTDIFKSASSKGAFYSAAFLLQRTLADDLDVDPEEVEIAAIESFILPQKDNITGRCSASIVLSDELPNGSGFIQQLYLNFEKYLNKCINPKPTDIYNYSIISNQDCLDASYGDLKNYRNMNYHPLLDWRLAIGLLRILADGKYLSGLQIDDYQYDELKNWLDFSNDLANKMAVDFKDIKYKKFSKLHGFCIADTYNVIITHPFWNCTTHQPCESLNILTEAITDAGLDNLYFIDTFNLHRRPGLCYAEIIKKIVNG